MDTQIENAIEIAWNPTSDQYLQVQAFEFLNQLRTNSSAWQVCLSLFTRSPKASEVVRLVCLEIVNNAVQAQTLEVQSLYILKDNLLGYVQRVYGQSHMSDVDSAGLQNKLSQTLTVLFKLLYESDWDNFFVDFLSLLSHSNSTSPDNLPSTVLYLRILGSIHDEIADVLLPRSGTEQKRNNELKNLLRARDAQRVARSWQEILSYWINKDDVLVEMCLKVISRWVSWIDISLIVNQESVNLLLQLVGRPNPLGYEDKVRNTAIDCFAEMVRKKMKATDKIGMIMVLNLENIIIQLISSPPLNQLRSTSNYDVDLAEAVARLTNNALLDIVKALEDIQVDNPTRPPADQLLQTFLPLILRFFSDEYDEVCCTVIPSLTELLTYFRKTQPLPSQYKSMLSPILNAIVGKMRYDETSSWGTEDDQTDEAEFQELRKKLQALQKSVAAVDQTLYVEILSNVVGNTFQSLDTEGSNIDWRDLDLALHEMYLFGELTVLNSGISPKYQCSNVASERLAAMMMKMVESGIAKFSHPAIQLQYMEICVRYCSFFESQTEVIPQVLEHFVGLVHHNHVRVRKRSWYLFGRFVKYLRALLGNVAETVIESISDLLTIRAEVSKEDPTENDMSDKTDNSTDDAFNSQLFLFEAVGCISSVPTIPTEKRALYARSTMNPLISDIEKHLPPAGAGDVQSILQVHHTIVALGALAHGFCDFKLGHSSSHPPLKEISDEFNRAADAVLIALEALSESSEIRTAARSSLSRLVGLVGEQILPQLPRWIKGLLSPSSSNDEVAMFLRSLDLIVFGFKSEIYNVLDSLLTPLFQRVFVGLAEPATGTDDEIQLGELRREYLNFIQVILNNNLGYTFVSDTNQSFFETLILSITGLAKSIRDGNGSLAVSRLAFSVLNRMATLWGGPDVATPSPEPVSSQTAPLPVLPGFDRFLIERFHPICWEVLRDVDFRPSADAQAKQVLTEIAGLEQMIYTKTGDMFIQHLQQSFFPSLGIDGSNFIYSMTTSPSRKVFAAFIQRSLKR